MTRTFFPATQRRICVPRLYVPAMQHIRWEFLEISLVRCRDAANGWCPHPVPVSVVALSPVDPPADVYVCTTYRCTYRRCTTSESWIDITIPPSWVLLNLVSFPLSPTLSTDLLGHSHSCTAMFGICMMNRCKSDETCTYFGTRSQDNPSVVKASC